MLLNALKEQNNVTLTENGGITYRSTMSALQDLFALGGAYRTRIDEECIVLFSKALEEDETLAMRCLFYLRDIRGGQGERRFFRVVCKWLAYNHKDIMERNLQYVPQFGRWDDLYTFVGTPLEMAAFKLMYHQLALDVECEAPSLLAKWLKSENTSSLESRELATKTREAFRMTPRQYRKTLSILRARINVLERLMSQNKWDEIEFDKIPSKAGIIYRNAFARHDWQREAANKQTYAEFAQSKETKVNAATLTPVDVVAAARGIEYLDIYDTRRAIINKYWENLTDYFHEAVFNGVAVVDTSGSMCWHPVAPKSSVYPIDVAIAMGMYCAEKCNPNSPFYKHYISFASRPQLISVDGADFVGKVNRIYNANLCDNTNIEAVFDLLLNTIIHHQIPQKEIPQNVIIISDMEFDAATNSRFHRIESVMEAIARKWQEHWYEMPKLIFWNAQARQDNIPMKDNGRVSFVSGFSPVILEQILMGKTGLELVLDKLNSERYACIY